MEIKLAVEQDTDNSDPSHVDFTVCNGVNNLSLVHIRMTNPDRTISVKRADLINSLVLLNDR